MSNGHETAQATRDPDASERGAMEQRNARRREMRLPPLTLPQYRARQNGYGDDSLRRDVDTRPPRTRSRWPGRGRT